MLNYYHKLVEDYGISCKGPIWLSYIEENSCTSYRTLFLNCCSPDSNFDVYHQQVMNSLGFLSENIDIRNNA